jgi:hypothetical protein
VYHFSEAAELIKDPEQRLTIARLNLNATIKGKNSMGRRFPFSISQLNCSLFLNFLLIGAAYEMARKVAAQGTEMLPDDAWETQHNLTFQLYLGTASPHIYYYLLFVIYYYLLLIAEQNARNVSICARM